MCENLCGTIFEGSTLLIPFTLPYTADSARYPPPIDLPLARHTPISWGIVRPSNPIKSCTVPSPIRVITWCRTWDRAAQIYISYSIPQHKMRERVVGFCRRRSIFFQTQHRGPPQRYRSRGMKKAPTSDSPFGMANIARPK